ncbi:MAG: PD-(D/E)XK nuclease family protein, partial [Candidatus Heimdallarchaeota archaeon]
MFSDPNNIDDEDIPTTISEKAPEVKNLSPTKIADQFWCEMQLHLRLQLGMEPTEVMITGTEIHRALEEELGPIIEVVVTTLEDNLITYILQLYTKLNMLQKSGITRELPVIGQLNNMPVLGIVDQLEIETIDNEKNLVITDYKTRRSKRAPAYEQKRRNRIQLQVYWYLLNNLRNGKFTSEMFKKHFEMPEKLEPSKELLEQLPEELQSILENNSAHELLYKSFQIFVSLPDLSNELRAIYLHQGDQSVVCSDQTIFHEESFEVDMEWALGYWSQNRTPSECPQQWMCK